MRNGFKIELSMFVILSTILGINLLFYQGFDINTIITFLGVWVGAFNLFILGKKVTKKSKGGRSVNREFVRC